MAHEYAHQVQDELGLFERYGQQLPTMAFELQADCYAGTWAKSAYRENRLEDGDVQEALDAALAVGDFDAGNPGHHGTPEQRQRPGTAASRRATRPRATRTSGGRVAAAQYRAARARPAPRAVRSRGGAGNRAMSATTRRRAGIALVVVTALLLAATAVCGYVRTALVDGDEFSARATSALENADVRSVVAERMVDGLTSSVAPDVLAVRPLVVPAVAALVNSSPFRRVFSRALSDRHRALIEGHTSFRFEIPLGEGLVFESVQSVAPRIARSIPRDLRVPVVRLDPREFELAGARFLTDFAGLWWPLLILSALAAGGCARCCRRGADRAGLPRQRDAGAGLTVAALRGRARRVRRRTRVARGRSQRRHRAGGGPRGLGRAVRRPADGRAVRGARRSPGHRAGRGHGLEARPGRRLAARTPRGRVAEPAARFARGAGLIGARGRAHRRARAWSAGSCSSPAAC